MRYARTAIENHRYASALLTVTVLFSCVFHLALSGSGIVSAQAAECTSPAKMTEIAPGAFVRQGKTALPDPSNRGGIANIGFIVGAKTVAVIDTGGSYCDGLGLLSAIRAKTALPIRHVINTHVHPDHIFGNSAFAGEGADILAHHNLPRALAERGEHYLRSYDDQIGEAAMKNTKIIPPAKLVKDKLEIDLGGRKLSLVAHAAAHTDADLTVFDETGSVLWTGDLVFLDHIPVLDGSLKGWLTVTSELMKVPANQIVPGHGPPLAPWPESGDNQRRYLESLARDLRQAISAGEGIRQAAGEAAKSERGKWRLFDSFNARNATTGYAELEWE